GHDPTLPARLRQLPRRRHYRTRPWGCRLCDGRISPVRMAFLAVMPHTFRGMHAPQPCPWSKVRDGPLESKMLVLHDDGGREFASGPAEGLPATKVGTFPQSLMQEATAKGWSVISMKRDWKRIFAFE